MNKVRSEMLYIAGISFLGCALCLKADIILYSYFILNGLLFIIRSFIVDVKTTE